jgi:hypothetical protein
MRLLFGFFPKHFVIHRCFTACLRSTSSLFYKRNDILLYILQRQRKQTRFSSRSIKHIDRPRASRSFPRIAASGNEIDRYTAQQS